MEIQNWKFPAGEVGVRVIGDVEDNHTLDWVFKGSDNIVFGIGSYTFQYNTRDTLGFAMKATYVEIDGKPQAIFKSPVTDSGTKKSARGLLSVVQEHGTFRLIDNCTTEQEMTGELRTVFLNGRIVRQETFADIRSRLNAI